jgi:hypothetical protein
MIASSRCAVNVPSARSPLSALEDSHAGGGIEIDIGRGRLDWRSDARAPSLSDAQFALPNSTGS